jgi:hypothetical protein
MWIRYFLIVAFSLTAVDLFLYQGVEIVRAIMEIWKQK